MLKLHFAAWESLMCALVFVHEFGLDSLHFRYDFWFSTVVNLQSEMSFVPVEVLAYCKPGNLIVTNYSRARTFEMFQ